MAEITAICADVAVFTAETEAGAYELARSLAVALRVLYERAHELWPGQQLSQTISPVEMTNFRDKPMGNGIRVELSPTPAEVIALMAQFKAA
jgi:hypothetical protein